MQALMYKIIPTRLRDKNWMKTVALENYLWKLLTFILLSKCIYLFNWINRMECAQLAIDYFELLKELIISLCASWYIGWYSWIVINLMIVDYVDHIFVDDLLFIAKSFQVLVLGYIWQVKGISRMPTALHFTREIMEILHQLVLWSYWM